MAKLKNGFELSGSLGGLSAYKRRDLDQVIIRSKGGPSKKLIQHGQQFETTRKYNLEFGGRATASKYILRALHPIKFLSDYNMAGPLNKILKPVQEADQVNALGERNIELSRSPHLLEGFNLNKRNLFESVLRLPVMASIHKENLTAAVQLPQLLPGIHFFPVDQYPIFRWQVLLGLVPDLYCNIQKSRYEPQFNFEGLPPGLFNGDWHPVNAGCESQDINLSLNGNLPPGISYCLLLVVGIAFGTIRFQQYAQVKYAGAGKVLLVN